MKTSLKRYNYKHKNGTIITIYSYTLLQADHGLVVEHEQDLDEYTLFTITKL